MVVYLIHFDKPIGSDRHQAQHYLGATRNLDERIQRHRTGRGSQIMTYVSQHGIQWEVSRTWDDAEPDLEKRLKSWHKARQLCPICNKTHEDGC